MMRGLIIVLAAILLTACGAKNSNTSSDQKPASDSKPAVGDSVVAKYKTGSFAEGKIQSLEGPKAKIDWSNKKELPDPDAVDLADVYPMPKPGDPTTVKAGDFALANTSSYKDGFWNKVEVKGVNSGTVTVKETNNYTHDISSDKVIAISQTESAKIKEMFSKFGKEQDFNQAAQKVRPIIPAEYKPKVGETVVAKGDLAWNTGKVKSISGDKATILWDPQNNGTFETTLDKIVPVPTAAGAAMPAVNDFILIKSGYMEVWKYAQVTGVNGTEVAAKDESGKTSTVKPGEFILLK